MSLGFDRDYPKLHEKIIQAHKAGIIMVAAVGNNKLGLDVEFPARYKEVIGVTAIDQAKHLAKFSTIGQNVEIAAPGVNITSTYLNNQYALGSGTSFAAPMVAAAICLIQSTYKKKFGRTMTDSELRQFIKDNCEDLGIKGKDVQYGYGMFKFK